MKTRKSTAMQRPHITPMLQSKRLHNKGLQNNKLLTKPILSAAFTGLVLSSISVIANATDVPIVSKPTFTLKVLTEEVEIPQQATRVAAQKKTIKKGVRQKQSNKNLTAKANNKPTKVIPSYKRYIKLKNGGVIWVSKDPSSLTPTLELSTSNAVEIENGKFSSPLSFKITTNYAHFIDNWELSVYDSIDDDLIKPLKVLIGRNLKSGRLVKWDGQLDSGKALKAGDKLKYVLKVRDKAGHFDETHAQLLELKGPNRNFKIENNADTRNNVSDTVESLARQTIPLHGSRVRIFGRDIAKDTKLSINGEKISLVDNKFITENLLPSGDHNFDIEVTENNNTYHESLDVHLKDKYMFMVGLADVTIGKGKVTGNLESLSDGDKHLDGDIFVDGRIAFYLKGKIKGKYLVTAQMDTGTAPIEELFDDIHKKDPQSLFRRLDPDKYYPVYGDDSTLIDDTNSQGKMYVRVDWDKSRAIWGNYNTDFTGTELSSFNRSLYGAKISHKSTRITKNGDHKTDVTVFASETQSAFRHNQFLGTGGSLYYLKDSDIVDGSEKVWIEVRERGSDRAVRTIVMEEGRDYEIDDFQGRIILHRPLLQIAEQSGPSLVKDNPLDGDQVFLMVDYEYVPDDFDSNNASYGARGKVWLNDHFSVGGTYAHDNHDNKEENFDMRGVDFTYKKSKGTYIKAEYAETESVQIGGSFLSDDGGLNFSGFSHNNASTDIEGSAYSLEARADLNDIISLSGSIGAWFKKRDAGFSTSRFNDKVETTESGFEGIINVNEKLDLLAKFTSVDRETISKFVTASLQGDYKLNDKVTLGAEIRHVNEEDYVDSSKDGEGVLGAFKVGYDVSKDVNVYVIAQGTIDKSGDYQDNNLFTVGAKAKINSKLDVNAEVSTGDRGDSALLGANYQMSDDYNLYANYTLSTDRTDGKRSAFTVGQRKSVTNRLKVYTEHQFTHKAKEAGVGHTFGLDYDLNKKVTASAWVQTAKVDKDEFGIINRDAFSVGLKYKYDKTDANTRLEYRRDKGNDENTEQWVTTNSVNYRVNPSLRLQGKLNYSKTFDKIGNLRNATFTEAAIGFALRPVKHDRLNVLGRLSYLYDLQPLSQSTQPDEKALIASLETSYQLDEKWEIGGKLAHKAGEIRSDRDSGSWEKNDATLAAVRARYHLTHKWDAMAEYHWMNSNQSQDMQHGAMLSIDRHIGKNMKIGIGYNFTDFDDDLSDTTGTAEGWFINLVGKY